MNAVKSTNGTSMRYKSCRITSISYPTSTQHCSIQSSAVSQGGSSKVIRKEFPELDEWLWGDSLWQDGYFSETVGRGSEMRCACISKSNGSRSKDQAQAFRPGVVDKV